MVVFASLSDYCRTIPLPLERNQQEIGNLPDYIIAAVFFDKIFNLFSWLSSICYLRTGIHSLFAVLFGFYPRQIWHIGLGEKYISITLCCILVYNRPYGLLLYKFYFPSGIIDPFISAVFVICCIILTNILKSGGVYNLLTTLGKEATSMWLIHTFISIYYWSGLTYSFQYPILIFLFVVICSYILSILFLMIL